jgi:hypothetical protein
MPRHYSQTIEINAAPAQVWPVMADVTRWAEWTPSITRVMPLTPGPFGEDSRARVHQPGLPPALWRVTEWNPGRQFTWVSVAPGVRVTARHEVAASPTGSRVTLSLNYEGLLGGLLARLTHRFNVSYLELEANGLKAHCEALAMRRTPPGAATLNQPGALGSPASGGRYLAILLAWLAAAVTAGATGLVTRMTPPWPQVLVFALTTFVLVAFWRGGTFRRWMFQLPIQSLVLLHLTRFVGFYFLALHARGELPYAFAVPGGWGDIAAATLALLVSLCPARTHWGRRAYLAWNVFGLADILFVVVTAARLFFANPDSMRALLHLPLSLLPTFLVPLIIATHVIIFIRLARAGRN